jgi:RNA polymerase sigma-70 factor (ECF subfamily)
MDHSPLESALEGIKGRIGDGDQQAFRQLFNYYCKKLTLFALSMVKSNEAAREIVDEVFIKIWRNRATINNIHNLKVYLYTATKNTALNYLAVNAKKNITEGFDFFATQIADEQSPDTKLINSEILKNINAAIESLPSRCKMVFKLVREDGLSYKEVAEILNISPKTVDAQMVIAVRHISERVKGHFDSFPSRPKKNL